LLLASFVLHLHPPRLFFKSGPPLFLAIGGFRGGFFGLTSRFGVPALMKRSGLAGALVFSLVAWALLGVLALSGSRLSWQFLMVFM